MADNTNPPKDPFPGPPRIADNSARKVPRPGSLLTCIILLFGLACVIVGVIVAIGIFKPEWIPFLKSSLGGKYDHLLIGVPVQDGRGDFYLLQVGQKQENGTLLVKNTSLHSGSLWVEENDEMVPITGLVYPYGGFIPRTNSLLYWYYQDNKLYLDQLQTNQITPTHLFMGDTPYIWGYVLTNPIGMFLAEAPNNDQVRCDLSLNGKPAVQLLSGQNCTLSGDLNTAYAINTVNDRFTLKLVNLANGKQYIPLEAQANVDIYSVSGDGSRVAYKIAGQPSEAILVNASNGEKYSSSGPVYDVLDLNFAQHGARAYYIAENESGDLELHLLDDKGSSLITTNQTLGAELSHNGQTMLYRAGLVGGEQTLFARDLDSGKEVELLKGDNIGYAMIPSFKRILISDTTSEFNFYAAHLDGSNLVKLYSQPGMSLEKIQYLPGEPFIYLFLRGTDQLYHVYATSIESVDGNMLVDGWESVSLLDISPNGKQVLLTGRRKGEDRAALYITGLEKGAPLQVVDDAAKSISNAVFTSSGDNIIYTVVTGDNSEGVEIRKAGTHTGTPVEVLYSGAFLISAQWVTVDAFQTLYMGGGMAATSFCPGAQSFAIGKTLHPTLTPGRADCYRLNGTQGQRITFWAQAENGLVLSLALYDRKGNYIEPEVGWQNGNNPSLVITYPADGIYFLQISSIDGSGGAYSLSAIEGANICAGAKEILPGDILAGVTPSNGFASYRFSAQADQPYTFWLQDASAFAGIAFFTPEGGAIESYPSLGTYNITVPADGNYCLLVSNSIGKEEQFSIGMATGNVYCPSAAELILDKPLSGDISQESNNCYYFTGEANTLYSLAVISPDGIDTLIELYDAQGNLLGSDDDSGGGYNPFLSFTLSQSGTYYAMVKGMYPDASGAFELSLVKGIAVCPNPQAIAAGDIISGSLQAGKNACYSFLAMTGESLDFYLEADLLTIMALYDQTGKEIASVGDTGVNFNPHLATAIPADGTYFLIITSWSGTDSGDYTLKMESMHASESCAQTARSIASNDVIEGNVVSGEQTCFSFSGFKGHSVVAWVQSPVDTQLVLYNLAGDELTRDDDSGGDTNPRLFVTLPYEGIYTLAVESNDPVSRAFILHIEEREMIHAAFDHAIELAWNTRTNGAITSESYLYLSEFQYDTHGLMYTFLGLAGDKIQIDVFADSLGSTLDPVINLFDSAHSSLIADDDSGTGYDSKIIYTLTYTGQYYIMVEDAHDRFGDPSSYFFEILLSR